jgi:hypothetical protein
MVWHEKRDGAEPFALPVVLSDCLQCSDAHVGMT